MTNLKDLLEPIRMRIALDIARPGPADITKLLQSLEITIDALSKVIREDTPGIRYTTRISRDALTKVETVLRG